MHRDTLSIDSVAAWARLNSVDLNRVQITSLPGNRGSGLIATSESGDIDNPLITIPRELILSQENVWIYAKSDRHLRQVLEAVGGYARVNTLLSRRQPSER